MTLIGAGCHFAEILSSCFYKWPGRVSIRSDNCRTHSCADRFDNRILRVRSQPTSEDAMICIVRCDDKARISFSLPQCGMWCNKINDTDINDTFVYTIIPEFVINVLWSCRRMCDAADIVTLQSTLRFLAIRCTLSRTVINSTIILCWSSEKRVVLKCLS